jgi:hypothetical protein
MSNFSFNPVIAQLYGVDEAVFLQNVYFWIEKNRVNNRHFYDDDYWTYNSVSAFSKLFPFWTTRQIERIIKKLEKEGVLKIGNYNSSAYDRTRWFALTEKINSIYENGVTHLRENVNQNTQKDEPIPDSNTDGKQQIVNTDINTPKGVAIPYQEIVDLYHKELPQLAQVWKLSDARKSKIKTIWKDELDDLDQWKNYFRHISKSAFLMGRVAGNDGRVFKADFDFIVNYQNFIKIGEDKYHGKKI